MDKKLRTIVGYKPIVAVVRFIDPKTDKVESTSIKAIDGKERREWITKTVMNGLLNGKMVEIVNQEDDKE